ncbi:MAG: hypothetical protein OEY29_08640 [Gammaproteobacteria bacterium]|nr:hypothetical protein [Gammaproteobacteria bacterium]
MKLKIYVEDRVEEFEIPGQLVEQGEDFFNKMDADLDKGWQMSHVWVDKPNQLQRCQIAADKMMSAIHNENEKMFMLMGAYILKNKPGTEEIHLDNTGEIHTIDFIEKKNA